MGKNYIPARDADFDRWFSFLYQYVSQKCAGSPPDPANKGYRVQIEDDGRKGNWGPMVQALIP
ncbi:MAG: hypothetical protein LBB68_02575 [Treponema sp.]|nr:hypothetical protein [Treponema sp.]